MAAPKIELTFIPAPDDPPLRSSKYQKGLHGFADALGAEGIKYGFGLDLIEAAAPVGQVAPLVYTGVFTLAKASWPLVAGLVGAWLHARSKRKVRIAIPGRVSAEAQTVKDVERLLEKAAEYQQIMEEIEKPKVKTPSPVTTKKASPTKKRRKSL